MKTTLRTTFRTAPPTQRAFTWAVRSTDIPFMDAEHHDLGADGCVISNCDCGCGISRSDAPRSHRAGQDKQP